MRRGLRDSRRATEKRITNDGAGIAPEPTKMRE